MADPGDYVILSKYEALVKIAQEGMQLLQQKNFEQSTATGFVYKMPDDEKAKYQAVILNNAQTLDAVVKDILLGLGVK